jgi:hypothetical protein
MEQRRPIRAGMAPGGLIRGSVLVTAVLLALLVVLGLSPSSADPTHPEVQNDTGNHVVLALGTRDIVDVPPHSYATITNRGSTALLYVQSGAPYKECSWEVARAQAPLVIDGAGAHCRDTRANSPPYPTPVPP